MGDLSGHGGPGAEAFRDTLEGRHLVSCSLKGDRLWRSGVAQRLRVGSLEPGCLGLSLNSASYGHRQVNPSLCDLTLVLCRSEAVGGLNKLVLEHAGSTAGL